MNDCCLCNYVINMSPCFSPYDYIENLPTLKGGTLTIVALFITVATRGKQSSLVNYRVNIVDCWDLQSVLL